MINHLDLILRHLIKKHVPGLRTPNTSTGQPAYAITDTQIGFRPPDDGWRKYVSNLTVSNQPARAINLYLVDIRENRALRSNERTRHYENGMILETPAPERIDVHYLISVWSTAIVGSQTDSIIDDEFVAIHGILYQVAAALMKQSPLVPQDIYAPLPVPSTLPAILVDTPLPTSVMPHEGFAKLPEFWSSMGEHHRWFPTLYVSITLPVIIEPEIAGIPVHTQITSFAAGAMLPEQLVLLYGSVVNGRITPSEPIASAWVQLKGVDGSAIHSVTTDNQGHYWFNRLSEGTYTLEIRAQGFTPASVNISIPGDYNNYTISLT